MPNDFGFRTQDLPGDGDTDGEVQLCVANGVLTERLQLQDYAYRPECFSDMCFVDFCVRTYDVDIKTSTASSTTIENGTYRVGHPMRSVAYRVHLGDITRCFPNFLGASFPSSTDVDERDLYHATMLMLYCPWVEDDVMTWALDWNASFLAFYSTCSPHDRSRVNNTQLRRQANEAADNFVHDDEDDLEDSEFTLPSHLVDDESDTSDLEGGSSHIPTPHQYPPSVHDWVHTGAELATRAGLLSSFASDPDVSRPLLSINADSSTLPAWKADMDAFSHPPPATSDQPMDSQDPPSANPSAIIPGFDPSQSTSTGSLSPNAASTLRTPTEMSASMNTAQRLTFDIVMSHLSLTLSAKADPPNQLLLKCLGAPGTGKSYVIDCISDAFDFYAATAKLQKCALQGSAAALIGGVTLHSWLSIRTTNSGKVSIEERTKPVAPSAQTISALLLRMHDVEYIIIDEISQVRISSALTMEVLTLVARLVAKCSRRLVNTYRQGARPRKTSSSEALTCWYLETFIKWVL